MDGCCPRYPGRRPNCPGSCSCLRRLRVQSTHSNWVTPPSHANMHTYIHAHTNTQTCLCVCVCAHAFVYVFLIFVYVHLERLLQYAHNTTYPSAKQKSPVPDDTKAFVAPPGMSRNDPLPLRGLPRPSLCVAYKVM